MRTRTVKRERHKIGTEKEPREEEKMLDKAPNDDTASTMSTASSDSVQSDGLVVPPDGGWGWVIVLASFMCAFFVDGLTSTFGVFYLEFLEYYQSDKAVTALAGSLVSGTFLFVGAISGALVNRFGCRPMAFLGGIITAVALVVCTFCPAIDTFLIAYGLMAGIGMGLVYVPSMLIVNFYFDKRRGIACGITSSGSGVGILAMAKLSEGLLQHFGWKGSHVIMAAMALNICVCASLFRPLRAKRKTTVVEEELEDRCVDNNDGVPVTLRFKYESPVPVRYTPASPIYKSSIPNYHNLAIPRGHQYQRNLYTSLPAVAHNLKDISTKSQCISAFDATALVYCTKVRPTTTSYNSPLLGRLNSHSTEWLNPVVNLDTGRSRLSSSMFTVNTQEPQEIPFKRTTAATKRVTMSPLVRKDIFFSGSVMSLEQFKSQPDMKHYIASVTIEETEIRSPVEKTGTSSKLCNSSMCNAMDLSLFKSKIFVLISVSSMLIQIAGFIPTFYLGNYGVSVGLETGDASTFLALIGFSSIVGRLVGGALVFWRPLQGLNITNFTVVLSGLACCLIPFCRSFVSICVMTSLFAFFLSFFPPIQPLILVRYLGLEKLSASFGLLTGIKGIATMVGPPFAGVLLDSTGTYVAPFCMGGGCLILSGLVQWLVLLADKPNIDGVSLDVEARQSICDNGNQTDESLVDSDEDRSPAGSIQLEQSPTV